MLQKLKEKFNSFGAARRNGSITKSEQLVIPPPNIVDYKHLHADNLRAQPLTPIPPDKIIHLDPVSLEKYEYHSVKYQGIRILKIHDEVLQFPDGRTQKKCSLLHCDLGQLPQYVALSYTWGCPIDDPAYMEAYKEPKEWILADNEEFFRVCSKELDGIGRNLYEALKRLSEDNYEPVKMRWIDQLCINQDDLEERASQVSLMGRIYSSCQKVIVWLGEELDRDIADFRALHRFLVPSMSHFMQANDPTALGMDDWDPTTFYERLNLDPEDCQFDWFGYYRFYSERRWFARAWVVQEVAFAPEVSFFCGNSEFSLVELDMIAIFLLKTGMGVYFFPSILPVDGTHAWSRILVFRSLQQTYSRFGPDWQKEMVRIYQLPRFALRYALFLECVGVLRATEALDDRDRVFAALGFLERGLGDEDGLSLKADYKPTTTVEDTYIRTATLLMQSLTELTLLSYVEDPSKRSLAHLPSWVPDFTVPYAPLRIKDIVDRYNATKGRFDQALGNGTIRIADNTLWLDGAEVDVIAGIQNTVQTPSTWDEEDSDLLYAVKLMHSWFNLLNGMGTVTPYSKVSHLEVLWRTLCINRLENPPFVAKIISSQMFHDFILYRFVDLQIRKHNGTLQQSSLPILKERYAVGPCWPKPSEFRHFTQVMIRLEARDMTLSLRDLKTWEDASLNTDHFTRVSFQPFGIGPDRRLFATEAGYLGLGPVSIQQGDQIWLFKGGRVPFVLRPVENGCYKLIGETYVHGVMNGEVWGS